MAISTTITRAAYEHKIEALNKHGYFLEFKPMNKFWRGRIEKQVYPTDIVFLIGREARRFKALEFSIVGYRELPPWVRALFRELNIYTPLYFALWCTKGAV